MGLRPVFQKVTKDKYGLVIAQADTMTELAGMVGMTISAISKAIKKAEKTGVEKEYRVTWIDSEEEDL